MCNKRKQSAIYKRAIAQSIANNRGRTPEIKGYVHINTLAKELIVLKINGVEYVKTGF